MGWRSRIHIREADEDERGKFDSSRAKAILEGEIGERECWKVYLVPVSDPTSEATRIKRRKAAMNGNYRHRLLHGGGDSSASDPPKMGA